MILARLWKRYVDFWNEREGPESLALVRITFALALIGNLLEQLFSGMLLELYADPGRGGVFPDEGSSTPSHCWNSSICQRRRRSFTVSSRSSSWRRSICW